MTWLDFVALILATWRVSSLLVMECGPLDIFLRIRCAVGIQHDDQGRPEAWNGGVLAGLFSCVWCMSIWAGGLLYLVWWLSPTPVYILAASCGAIIIAEVQTWQQKSRSPQS